MRFLSQLFIPIPQNTVFKYFRGFWGSGTLPIASGSKFPASRRQKSPEFNFLDPFQPIFDIFKFLIFRNSTLFEKIDPVWQLRAIRPVENDAILNISLSGFHLKVTFSIRFLVYRAVHFE